MDAIGWWLSLSLAFAACVFVCVLSVRVLCVRSCRRVHFNQLTQTRKIHLTITQNSAQTAAATFLATTTKWDDATACLICVPFGRMHMCCLCWRWTIWNHQKMCPNAQTHIQSTDTIRFFVCFTACVHMFVCVCSTHGLRTRLRYVALCFSFMRIVPCVSFATDGIFEAMYATLLSPLGPFSVFLRMGALLCSRSTPQHRHRNHHHH